MRTDIQILQGKQDLEYAEINIVIDVIRAFTVSYNAFKYGVDEIILVANEQDAFYLRDQGNDYVISGEVNGYKIDGFDFGNSPYELSRVNLIEKTLIQKTTNGVEVTLNSLNADKVFVTGYVNALTLVNHIKEIIKDTPNESFRINIIASHPSGDDDLACAEYIKELLLNDNVDLKKLDEETIYRISNSEAAQKFWNQNNLDFSVNDIVMTLSPDKSDFVMEVMNLNDKVKLQKRIIL